MEVPNEYLCPIRHEIMKYPVICDDGHTYEKKEIINWLRHHQTSPMTRERVSNKLIPNRIVKNLIQIFLEDYPNFNPDWEDVSDCEDLPKLNLQTEIITPLSIDNFPQLNTNTEIITSLSTGNTYNVAALSTASNTNTMNLQTDIITSLSTGNTDNLYAIYGDSLYAPPVSLEEYYEMQQNENVT